MSASCTRACRQSPHFALLVERASGAAKHLHGVWGANNARPSRLAAFVSFMFIVALVMSSRVSSRWPHVRTRRWRNLNAPDDKSLWIRLKEISHSPVQSIRVPLLGPHRFLSRLERMAAIFCSSTHSVIHDWDRITAACTTRTTNSEARWARRDNESCLGPTPISHRELPFPRVHRLRYRLCNRSHRGSH